MVLSPPTATCGRCGLRAAVGQDPTHPSLTCTGEGEMQKESIGPTWILIETLR